MVKIRYIRNTGLFLQPAVHGVTNILFIESVFDHLFLQAFIGLLVILIGLEKVVIIGSGIAHLLGKPQVRIGSFILSLDST